MFRLKKPKSGMKLLCGFNKKNISLDPPNVTSYVNDLNSFYAGFDVHNFNLECENILSAVRSINAECILITHEDIMNSLERIQSGKASGPDNICKLLKTCAEQLAEPMRIFFQTSLDQCVVANMLKTSEMIPVSKNNNPNEFNLCYHEMLKAHYKETPI